MARAYCVHWSANDPVRGTRTVGWSLHLSRSQAAAYIQAHEAEYAAHDEPRCLEVPAEMREFVQTHPQGMFWATPLACPFPVVDDAEVERERKVVVARELPGDTKDREEQDRDQVNEEEPERPRL